METDLHSAVPAEDPKTQPKRRACDECRSRKLACSKEVDGCLRCRGEGIQCHYSAQKPMGRPRKSPHDNTDEMPEQPDLPAGGQVNGSQLPESMDVDFLDVANWDADSQPPELNDMLFSQLNLPMAMGTAHPIVSPAPWPISLGHLPNQINFDVSPSEIRPRATEISLEQAAQLIAADLPDTVPGLSPNSTTTSEPSQGWSPPDSLCQCLPTLYAALDTLHNTPAELMPAIRAARAAAKAAHKAIQCPICAVTPLEDLQDKKADPPLRSVQTLMMIGAIIPSMVNQYMRVLDLVDQEAKRADAERRRIHLSLEDLGGLYGPVASPVDPCGISEHFSNLVMEPAEWRLTVRALFKLDVYGAEGADAAEDLRGRQLGLDSILQLVEERCRGRHRKIDEMIASNALKSVQSGWGMTVEQEDRPTCQRILETAKSSLTQLSLT